MSAWEQKEVQKPSSYDFYKHAIQINICKLKVGIFQQYIMVKVPLCKIEYPIINFQSSKFQKKFNFQNFSTDFAHMCLFQGLLPEKFLDPLLSITQLCYIIDTKIGVSIGKKKLYLKSFGFQTLSNLAELFDFMLSLSLLQCIGEVFVLPEIVCNHNARAVHIFLSFII